MSIIIKNITPPTVIVCDPENKFIGNLNEYEFSDLRVQIKKYQIEGYHVVFANENETHKVYNIDKDGRIENWPAGLFDQIEKYLIQLI